MSPARLDMHFGADGAVAEQFLFSRAPTSIIRGPLGSGKTITCAQRMLIQTTEQPPNPQGVRPTRWAAIRNTYLDLTETTIKDFKAVWDGLGEMRYGGLEPPNFRARFPYNMNGVCDGTIIDAEVIFLALDRPDSIRKLKGYQLTGGWPNEVSEISKAIIDMLDLRHGRYPSMASGGVPCGWHGIFGDTNSFDTSHWLWKLEQRRPEGWEFFAQPGGVIDTGDLKSDGTKIWRVNPHAENLRNLPADYYQRGMSAKDDDWIKVMLSNEFGFTVNGQAVHPRFLNSRHVAKKPLEFEKRYPIFLGLDFGRTPAAVIFQRIDHIGRYHVLAEFCSEDMSASIFAPELFRFIRQRWGDVDVMAWGDPAGDGQGQATEDTPILICRAAGIPVQPAASNIFALRKAALDNPLTRSCLDGGPAILIDPRCETLIKGLMGGYHYRQLQVSGPEPRIAEAPEKNFYSHVSEAMHYGLMGAGEMHTALRAPVNPERQRQMDSFEYSELTW